jgi:hypothetical protein
MGFLSSLSNLIVSIESLYRNSDIDTDEIIKFNSDRSVGGSGIKYYDVESKLNKDIQNGYPGLDGSGKINISVIPSSLLGSLSYQGSWNASTNNPTIQSSIGTKGYYYVVSVSGNTNIDGINSWATGDWIVFNGSVWQKIDNTDLVVSVNGKQGVVILDKTDIGLSNVPNVDTTNAANISSGTLNQSRLPSSVVILTLSQTITNKTLGTGTRINIGTIANGDLYYCNNLGNLVRIPIGSNGDSFRVVGGIPAWQSTPASSSKIYLQASLSGEANSTIGLFTKSSEILVANPSGKTLTTPYDPGFNNGSSSPWLITENRTISKLSIKISGAAVGTGTVSSPVARFRVYRVDYSTRTQLGVDIDIPINPSGVGTFNNTSGNSFQFAQSSALATAVNAGDLIGIEFVNISGSDSGINAIRVVEAILELS